MGAGYGGDLTAEEERKRKGELKKEKRSATIAMLIGPSLCILCGVVLWCTRYF